MAVDRSRLPLPGPEPQFNFPHIERRSLSNGLRIWTVEHRQVPLVSVLLVTAAGAAADPEHQAGLAAMTADMLDEGCGDRSALDIHETLGRLGAQLDTDVGHDATVLGLTTLRRFLSEGIGLVAEMMLQPRFAEADVDRVRDLRLNRLLQYRDSPPALADRAFAELLYREHPYGHLPIGTERSLRAIGVDDVRRFHARAFRPELTTVIAAGDGDHETLAAAVARAFDGWHMAPAAEPLPGPSSFGEPFPPSNRLAVVHRPGAAQSELRIGHVALARRTPDYHACVVLNMILGGQFVSRINMNLRQDKGYTYGARTAFEFRRAPGPFAMHASVQGDATADAIRETLQEFRAIRGERPVTVEELAVGRAALTRGYPRNFETSDQIARAAAQLALYELPDDYFSTFVPTILALGPDDITHAAERHLHPERAAVVVVGDREKIGASLASLDLGDTSEMALA
ncbi:MAG TPA: pitrilysin family protein [Vicinamibacterales bacterium]|jgi:zinc protease|nr:pitrilysin family protein [Vicinamibacterales bacterium]